MGEPQRLGAAMLTHDPAEARAQSRLLAEIRQAGRLSDGQQARMMATLDTLRAQPPAWLATRYLQSVASRGPAMFDPPVQQQLVDAPDRLVCPCGAPTPVEDVVSSPGRVTSSGLCPVCRSYVGVTESLDTRPPESV